MPFLSHRDGTQDSDLRFVLGDMAERYIWFLDCNPPTRFNSSFRIFYEQSAWEGDKSPLTLTLFLAYKLALAYYELSVIRKDLYENHPIGGH